MNQFILKIRLIEGWLALINLLDLVFVSIDTNDFVTISSKTDSSSEADIATTND
jgi:hypothetical protein